jgi:hypothetical protein
MDNLDFNNSDYIDTLDNVEKSDVIKKNVEKILEFCLIKENRTLRRENMDQYKQKCMREFSFMHQKYPTLFFSLIENPTTFPIYRLEEMLSLKRKIEIEQETTDSASVKVGQQYYEEFVKDTVDELNRNIKK